MQWTQKLVSSYFQRLMSSSMTTFCSAIPFIFGTNPGSQDMQR